MKITKTIQVVEDVDLHSLRFTEWPQEARAAAYAIMALPAMREEFKATPGRHEQKKWLVARIEARQQQRDLTAAHLKELF